MLQALTYYRHNSNGETISYVLHQNPPSLPQGSLEGQAEEPSVCMRGRGWEREATLNERTKTE